MAKTITEISGLSQDQLDRIEQFEADYNAIDRFLRNELNCNSQVPFTALVTKYSEKHKGWHQDRLLRTIADLRNAMVHGKTEPYRYIAVPTPATVQDLHSCRTRLMKPECVIPVFQRDVKTVSADDSLAHVLKLVRDTNFSQFPVMGAHGFRGLLTENGITRWLAEHVGSSMSLVEFDDITVAQALADEEKRQNARVVARNARVDDVIAMFAANRLLEAVLITETGKVAERFLGIATRWDVLGL